MSATANTLQREQARLLTRLDDAKWLRGVGIALVDGQPGLVISAASGAGDAAAAAVQAVKLKVPFRIREVGLVRKRPRDA
jgi:regulation of enolase protein 1 (concanavalin A-like superfamily)